MSSVSLCVLCLLTIGFLVQIIEILSHSCLPCMLCTQTVAMEVEIQLQIIKKIQSHDFIIDSI